MKSLNNVLTDESWDSINCLSNSLQRIQLLNVLDNEQADLRSLKDDLEIPRTTVQRNLSVLEQRNWIKETAAGYATTPAGSLLVNEFVRMAERVKRIDHLTPFLNIVDAPTAIEIDRLDTSHLTVPEPGQPNAPLTHLLEMLEMADNVHGFLPVVSPLLVDRYRHANEDVMAELEVVFSADALNGFRERSDDNQKNRTGLEQATSVEVWVSEDDLSYGLLILEDKIVLIAYDDIREMKVVVESSDEAAIEWGERTYENYKCQSSRLHEVDVPHSIRDLGTAD